MKLKFYTPLLYTAREVVARQFLPVNPPFRNFGGPSDRSDQSDRTIRNPQSAIRNCPIVSGQTQSNTVKPGQTISSRNPTGGWSAGVLVAPVTPSLHDSTTPPFPDCTRSSAHVQFSLNFTYFQLFSVNCSSRPIPRHTFPVFRAARRNLGRRTDFGNPSLRLSPRKRGERGGRAEFCPARRNLGRGICRLTGFAGFGNMRASMSGSEKRFSLFPAASSKGPRGKRGSFCHPSVWSL